MIYQVMFRQRFRNGMRNIRKLLLDDFLVIVSEVSMYISICYWIYHEGETAAARSFRDAVTYLVIVTLSCHISRMNGEKLAHKVAKGKFGYEILLPYSYPAKVLTEAAADLCRGMLLEVLPAGLLLTAAGWIVLPQNLPSGILGIGSLLLGVLLRWMIQLAIQMMGFWYKDMINVRFVMRTLYLILGGAAVPYWLFPERLTAVLSCMPFAYVWILPMKIYFSELSAAEACQIMLIQITQTAFLAGAVSVLYSRGKRRIQAAD